MYGLTEAIIAVVNGATSIISGVSGKRYTAEELQPKKLGGRVAVFNDLGMTKKEREGGWQVGESFYIRGS